MPSLVTESPTLNRFLSIARLQDYRLPGNPGTDLYVVGVSGGADSTVTAILLSRLFPDQPFVYCFTDTGTEVDGTEASLKALEAYTGREVLRVSHGDTLFSLIDDFNGYLPSGQNRWCTRILKTEVYEDFMEELRGDREVTVHSFVGLRADEPARSGLDSSMPWLRTHFPMRDLGMARADVFAVLQETIGVPSFYKFRSRSGCSICWAMRPSEIIGTLERHPASMVQAERTEKLAPGDRTRFAVIGEDWSGIQIEYPIPAEIDMRESRRKLARPLPRQQHPVDELFGRPVRLYVGVEFFQSKNMMLFDKTANGTPGIWWHGLVGWSTTRGGMARKLNAHYRSRLDAPEAWMLTEEEFQEEYRQAIMLVEIPPELIDVSPAASTVKDPDGRLVDEAGRSILVDGAPVYLRNRKFSKQERATMRKQGVTRFRDWQIVDREGRPVSVLINDEGVPGGEPRALDPNRLLTARHTDERQAVLLDGETLSLGGRRVFREKKGRILETGTFSWRKGEPIAQIRAISSILKKTLHIESLRQQLSEYAPFRGGDSWEGEQYAAIADQLAKLDLPRGRILGMEEHKPTLMDSPREAAGEIPCFACSK